jgi:alanine racemase
MEYTFSKIKEILDGEVLQEAGGLPIKYLGADSRNIPQPEATLFFAIRTTSGDGHRYLKDCYTKGIRNFIVENPFIELSGCNIIRVGSAIEAMQKIAARHREQFNIPIIGITGSNGKTIVKEWLYQLLRNDYSIAKSPKSYNSQIGVPLSVWKLDGASTLGIFEAGISKPGEMEKLEKVIKPTIGIFTNLGSAHQANFSSAEEKLEEKLKLFVGCESIIYCKDVPGLDESIGITASKQKRISWGQNQSSDIVIAESDTSIIKLNVKGIDYELTIPFTDKASFENIMHCYTLLHLLGYSHEESQKRISLLQPVEMRLEIKSGINGCTVINDAYNSDPASLAIAIETLLRQKQHNKKTLILSDILESEKNEEELYSSVAEMLSIDSGIKLVGIGPALMRQKDIFPLSSGFYESTEKFLAEFNPAAFRDEAILLKGSRVFGFERIAAKLQQKAHTTVMEINLDALIHNLNTYRSFLKPGVKVMAMVKAASYGSGAHEIANVLQFHKVDYLAVAYADEGVYLRQNGISLPIMVMNPDEGAFEAILANKLEPEIYSLRLLRQFLQFIDGKTVEEFPVHIKIDTGMHRLGFEKAQIAELCEILKETPGLKIVSLFTHLAATESAVHDDFTRAQLSTFTEACSIIEDELKYPVLKHALNSAGAARFPEAQFDMVRLGIGLYGIDPGRKIQEHLEPVNTLKTHISQLKNIRVGESVGYSRNGMLKKDSIIATIGIGYADGFPRSLGNGVGCVFVNGKQAPVIGSVCMDMCMIDVTGIDATEGDEVIVFDKEHSVELLADKLKTIPYEVLTNISQRVKRVYYKE